MKRSLPSYVANDGVAEACCQSVNAEILSACPSATPCHGKGLDKSLFGWHNIQLAFTLQM